MTFISAGLMGARANFTLSVFGGGDGKEGNVRADMTEGGGPFDVYTIARFARLAEDVEN